MFYYITTLFAPTRTKLDENIRSLKSFADYINHYNYNVTIIVGGWIITDELWNITEKYINEIFKYKIIVRFDKNYGKAYVINNLVKKYLMQFKTDYFLTADSDIIFPLSTEYLFDRLYEIPNQSEKHFNKKFGMVALNQEAQCCHIKELIYENKYTYLNKYNKEELIVYPSHPSGIAGGSLFTSLNAWNTIGGYRILNVYGGDDGYYLVDINNYNYSYQMSDTISIIHPFSSDQEYAKWKVETIRSGHTQLDMNGLIEKTKLADSFWLNKK